jgi:hypothetical protein
MIERFRNTNFRPDSRAKIDKMVEIVDEYQNQGLRLTARQLYYQFVSRDLIANTPAEYKKLTCLLADARYAGLVDWDAIEDRGRQPETPSEWKDIQALVESAVRAYRLPRWAGQERYVELWVEKQALAGVLAPLANEFHVTLMVNKGYSSASAMYDSAVRIKRATGWTRDNLNENLRAYRAVKQADPSPEALDAAVTKLQTDFLATFRPTTIFYLGDHDPSGEDMVRDIKTRLVEFHREFAKIDVVKIALTMDQIQQYNPPPNPAKMSDSRAAKYVAKHGGESWEVDALPPNVLAQLIRDAFEEVVDTNIMDEIKEREEIDKAALRKAAARIVKKG